MATTFLTRIPLPVAAMSACRGVALGNALAWAPIVGLLIAVLSTLVAWPLVVLGAAPAVLGLCTVAFMTWFTRALHEDGLADYCDGIGGGWTPERRLEIMDDSRIGTFGTLALICLIGLKALSLAAIAQNDVENVFFALVAACCLSRATFLVLLRQLPPCKPNGLGHSAGYPNTRAMVIALASSLVLAVSALGIWRGAIAIAVCAIVYLIMVRQARAALGGQTGDVAGAIQQCCETSILIVLSLELS